MALGDDDMSEVLSLHERFAVEVKEYLHANANFLEFLLDAERSRELEGRVRAMASEDLITTALDRLEVQATEAFYVQMEKVFGIYRLRIQIALANGTMTEAQMTTLLQRLITGIVNRKVPPVELTQSDGVEVRGSIWQELRKRDCPPLWRAQA